MLLRKISTLILVFFLILKNNKFLIRLILIDYRDDYFSTREVVKPDFLLLLIFFSFLKTLIMVVPKGTAPLSPNFYLI